MPPQPHSSTKVAKPSPNPEKRAPLVSGATLLGGHLKELRTDQWGLMARFNRECGAIGRLRLATESLLVANAPELVEELLVEKAHGFEKSRVLRLVLAPLAGNGLFTSEGEVWRRQRKLMAPLFHPAKIADYAPAMTEAALHSVDGWAAGSVVDVAREMTRVTMSVAGRALFGVDLTDESDELGAALTTALAWTAEVGQSLGLFVQAELSAVGQKLRPGRKVDTVGQPILWPGARSRRLKEALAVLEDRVARMIAERREGAAERTDLLARLLGARDGSDGYQMAERQLRDEILTLFVAGHETTATALAWSLYLLARAPEVRGQLEAEVAGLDGRPPTAADLPRLALATRVFKEALRLYPPVPFYERQARSKTTLGGCPLAGGAYAVVLPWALHHRPELWPDPERFDPDRFTPEAEAARPRYAYVPFGAGPRFCIGSNFALYEGTLALATVVQRARLELVDDTPVKPDPAAATLRPLGGIHLKVERRN